MLPRKHISQAYLTGISSLVVAQEAKTDKTQLSVFLSLATAFFICIYHVALYCLSEYRGSVPCNYCKPAL